MTDQILDKPLFQLTLGEFIEAMNGMKSMEPAVEEKKPTQVSVGNDGKKYVYGINGIAQLFGCSKPTANRIKRSGKIDGAITQIGRKIIVDADKALELAGIKTGGRGAKR